MELQQRRPPSAKGMRERWKSQFVGAPSAKGGEAALGGVGAPVKIELIVPNPKLKLLEQVREVMRLRHYSIRTEQCYCDWIRRYIKFHEMQSRAELSEGEGTSCASAATG